MAKITTIRGDDKAMTIYVKNKDGSPYDLTECLVLFTVKKRDYLTDENDDRATIKKTCSIVDKLGGEAGLELTTIDTDHEPDDYFYDFKIKNKAGKVVSSQKDSFEIIQDVSKRIISA